MINKLLSATCAIALLASCSRQTSTATFQRASTESIARQTVAVPAPAAVSAPGSSVAEVPVATETTTSVALEAAEPVLVASAASETEVRTVATPSRAQARQAARMERVQQLIANAKAPQAVGATETRKLTGAEKMISKIVAKKINKQVAKGQKAKAIGGNVAVGIVLIGVAIILGLIGINGILTAIVAVIGVLFLILGLLNSASLANLF